MISTYSQPIFPTLLLLLFIGLFRVWRRSQKQKPILLAVALVTLFLVSWFPFEWLAEQPFERPFPRSIDPSNDAQAIVVLGGSIQYSTMPDLPVAWLDRATYEACQYAAYLHNHWRPLPVLVSGGRSNPPRTNEPPRAILMKDALVMYGVPQTMIWPEIGSLTTHENAVFSAEILRQKGKESIVLVTDARHMWRAELAFRKQGLKVVPAACDYRSGGRLHPTDLLPDTDQIRYIEEMLHETLGLIWYKVHGWI
jgi:uncharacterized SAM-binding protein YcdF (DUF218 family)